MSSDGNNIPVASTVLGTIGTVLWCVQLIPQIWYNWRQKKTDGLPPVMMFLWAACEFFSFFFLSFFPPPDTDRALRGNQLT